MDPVSELIGNGPAVLVQARALDLSALSPRQLLDAGRTVRQIMAQAQALSLALTAEATRQQAHQTTGATSMTSLIAEESGVSRKDAHEQITLATALENQAPTTRKVLTRPGMSTDKAKVITRALADLPDDLHPDEVATIEADLAAAAPAMSIEQLRRKARRAIESIDVRRADETENHDLTQAEEAQLKATRFWMSRPDEHGIVKGGFTLPALEADMLRSILDARTSPRYRGNENADPADLQRPRAHDQRLGHAFSDLISHLPTDVHGNHGGAAATLVVTISEDSLRERTNAAGTTDYGTRIPAARLRRLACEAGIVPLVLGSDSQPLDIGREARLHTTAQRRALAHRDQGCAFPHCDRPPGWCEAHHIQWWSHGGRTSTSQGVLLCAHHHRLIHNSGWTVTITHDGTPEFTPPAGGTPQRNHRYRPLIAA